MIPVKERKSTNVAKKNLIGKCKESIQIFIVLFSFPAFLRFENLKLLK